MLVAPTNHRSLFSLIPPFIKSLIPRPIRFSYDGRGSSSLSLSRTSRRRRHLPERARISRSDLRTLKAAESSVELARTVGAPIVTNPALDGVLFDGWERYRRIGVAWDLLIEVENRADLQTIQDLPARAHRAAKKALVEKINGDYQIPSFGESDRFAVPTVEEALYGAEMKRVLVDGEGDDSEVAAMVFETYAMRPPSSYSVAPVEGRHRALHRLDVLGMLVFGCVFNWQEFDVSRS